jgi:hypothetical protein
MMESAKFAAAEAPDGLSEEDKISVDKIYKESFIDAFNNVVYIASIMTFLGGIMAFIFIRQKVANKLDQELN